MLLFIVRIYDHRLAERLQGQERKEMRQEGVKGGAGRGTLAGEHLSGTVKMWGKD